MNVEGESQVRLEEAERIALESVSVCSSLHGQYIRG